MNIKDIIITDDTSARIELVYKGTPEAGMLAWLDNRELKLWWKADSVIVEPFNGGMFYLTWQEVEKKLQHAIYGIVDIVDTENNVIEVNKIMYISPIGKMGHLHLHINFRSMNNGQTKMTLIHTHNYYGQMLRLYNEAVYTAWPKTYSLLKKYLENQSRTFE
jgi:hypothetical protein